MRRTGVYERAVLLDWLLGGLAGLSLVLLGWQWTAARRFPLHQRLPLGPQSAPVTVFKPLKSGDEFTEPCLRSWLNQRYDGPVQFLFGVEPGDDSAAAAVRKLLPEFTGVHAALHICPPPWSANAKVSKLATLARHARHELWIISDADVIAPPDVLAQLVDRLADPRSGLVSCLYRLADAPTMAMRLERISANADFWSQVLQARTLKPMDFALGAVMATRKTRLDSIGGFEALENCLADDYQLGHRIARQGFRIELSPVVVECRSGRHSWRSVWKHQLRWARTIRVCQPLPYFFSVLSNPTFWPALWAAARPGTASVSLLGLALLARLATAFDLQTRLAGRAVPLLDALLAPIKDLLGVGVWFAAHLGRTVEWRGDRFRLNPDGTLQKRD